MFEGLDAHNTHTYTRRHTARFPYKLFTTLFKAQASSSPTNYGSVYSDELEDSLFGPITDDTLIRGDRIKEVART